MMRRLAVKAAFGAILGALFLLPFFSWISAEPAPYRDPDNAFTIVPPDGWKADSSGHMGPGVVMKGKAGPAGVEPSIHLIREKAGIVTLDVRWHTHLGQLRYDLTRVKFLGLEDHEGQTPPFSQATYSHVDGEQTYLSLVRLVLHEEHFYLMTATAPEGEFEALRPAFLAAFDSLRPGMGD